MPPGQPCRTRFRPRTSASDSTLSSPWEIYPPPIGPVYMWPKTWPPTTWYVGQTFLQRALDSRIASLNPVSRARVRPLSMNELQPLGPSRYLRLSGDVRDRAARG